MLIAVWFAIFVYSSLCYNEACNEVGTCTLEMQCYICFKLWETWDAKGPSGIPLLPNWISHIVSQQLHSAFLLQDKCSTSWNGTVLRISARLLSISGVPNHDQMLSISGFPIQDRMISRSGVTSQDRML
jgi:hypothetical protein